MAYEIWKQYRIFTYWQPVILVQTNPYEKVKQIQYTSHKCTRKPLIQTDYFCWYTIIPTPFLKKHKNTKFVNKI
jgi:hypothetical protein